MSKITYPGANLGFQGDNAPDKDARDKSNQEALTLFRTRL